MSEVFLPAARAPLVDRQGRTTREFYRFFQQQANLVRTVADGGVTTGGTSAPSAPDSAQILSSGSILQQGILSGGVVRLSLVNDAADPSPGSYYGTGQNGSKGFFSVSDAAPIQSIVKGSGIAIDTTDPKNPVVSATGGSATGHYDGGNAASVYTLAQHTFDGGGANG